MNNELKIFLSQYIQLPDEEMDFIVSKFNHKKVKRNEFVLQQGEVCKDLIFVKEGCIRLYYIL
ncbi:MAG: hypothetical protein R2807_11610, partial [Chitinophagales bacterium]